MPNFVVSNNNKSSNTQQSTKKDKSVDSINNNPFYNSVDKKVVDELDRRKNMFANLARGTAKGDPTMGFLYGKTAYVIVKTNESGKKDKYLASIPQGGFKDMYVGETYRPKPVITSVHITNEGYWGSLQKVTVNFQTFSLAQIDELMEDFFTIGNKVIVQYGWTRYAGSGDTFEGAIYNFSFSINSYGGFDCSIDIVGEGWFTLGADIQSTDASNTATDTNNIKRYVNNFYAQLEDDIKNISKRTPPIGTVLRTNFSTDNKNETVNTDDYYFSLELIIYYLNKFLFSEGMIGKDKSDKLQILCNKTSSLGRYSNTIISADPLKVLLPSEKYGDVNVNYPEKFNEGNYAYLGRILINYQYLIELKAELESDKYSTSGATGDSRVQTFLNNIFNVIANSTSDFYKLTLIQTDSTANLVVVDTNFIGSDSTSIKPYTFTAIKNGSMLRRINLTSKLPPAMATAAYVAARATINGTKPTLPGTTVTESSLSQDDVKKIYVAATEGMTKPFTEDKVQALKNALRTVIQLSGADDLKQTKIPYPLNLELTLDGIAGFRFGNTISIDWLPKIYQDAGIAFTVTKIEHNLANNDWTTTLQTVCRLDPVKPSSKKTTSLGSPSQVSSNVNTTQQQNANTSFNNAYNSMMDDRFTPPKDDAAANNEGYKQ